MIQRDRADEVPENQTPENYLGVPVKLSINPGTIRAPSPEFGANTRVILLELGYSNEDITQFELEEVI